MKHHRLTLVMLASLLLTIVAYAADASQLTFKFTKVKVPGAFGTFLLGVNNGGVTVGSYYNKQFVDHGFRLNGERLKKINDPEGTNTGCVKVNSNGAIVGNYVNSKGFLDGFLYWRGKFTDVPGPLGTVNTFANGINDAGDIVGAYYDSSQHGYLLRGTTYSTLDVPGALLTVANSINNKGTIVVDWVDWQGNFQSSLTKDNGKTYKTISVPGAVSSEALGINNAGDVVYEWLDSSNHGHGALLHSGKYYTFDFPNSAETLGGGINDHQVIVGGYRVTTGGPWKGFKATYK